MVLPPPSGCRHPSACGSECQFLLLHQMTASLCLLMWDLERGTLRCWSHTVLGPPAPDPVHFLAAPEPVWGGSNKNTYLIAPLWVLASTCKVPRVELVGRRALYMRARPWFCILICFMWSQCPMIFLLPHVKNMAFTEFKSPILLVSFLSVIIPAAWYSLSSLKITTRTVL